MILSYIYPLIMDSVNCNDLLLSKGVKMAHINIRSLFKKIDQLRESFAGMDVIVVGETWLTPSIPNSAISIPGYRLFRVDRMEQRDKRGGGLCIYVKSMYTIKPITDCYNIINENIECLGIQMKHPHIKPFNILGVYRPPTGNKKTFLKLFKANLTEIINERSETYIMGDFNIDYLVKDNLQKYRDVNIETKYNLYQLITSHTRITQHTATLLDWIYSDSQYISNSGTINLNISDHLPVFLVRKKVSNVIEKHTTTGRSYLRYDKDQFGHTRLHQDWSTFDRTTDVDKLWVIIEVNISKSLDTSCPIRTLTVSNTKPEWLNNEVLQLMRKRDTAYRKAGQTKTDIDWRKATFLRNRVESFIKQFKKRKITNSLTRHRSNPAKFWKEIRTVLPKEKIVEVTSLIDEETGQSFKEDQLCDYINKYFVNIGKKLANKIIQNQGSSLSLRQTVLNNDRDRDREQIYALQKINYVKL